MDIARIRKKLKKSGETDEQKAGEESKEDKTVQSSGDSAHGGSGVEKASEIGDKESERLDSGTEQADTQKTEEVVKAETPEDEVKAEAVPANEIEILAFTVANEEYAVKITELQEVLRNQRITAVPRAPKYLKGVTFLRGRILPVIDLKYRLGLKGENGGRQKIIVLAIPKEPVGALVSPLLGAIRIPETELLQPPATLDVREKSFIEGVVKTQDRFISILNVDELVKIS